MIATNLRRFGVLCALAVIAGCAMPVSEDVEEQAEALNFTGDFKLGIVNIRYNEDGSLDKGKEVWTSALSEIIGGGVISPPSYVAAPTGVRIGLRTYAGQPASLTNLDFRLAIETGGHGRPAGDAVRTRWASDGGGQTTGGRLAGVALPVRPDAPEDVQIGIETRPWPSAMWRPFFAFRVGISACALATPIVVGCTPSWEYTPWSTELPNGGTAWSHTSNVDGFPNKGVMATLEVAFR